MNAQLKRKLLLGASAAFIFIAMWVGAERIFNNRQNTSGANLSDLHQNHALRNEKSVEVASQEHRQRLRGDSKKEHEIPAALRGNIHINAFDFDSMKSKDRELGVIGMGAKEAQELENLMINLQTMVAESESNRFMVLKQDERSIVVGIPGTSRMSAEEKRLIDDLKKIAGKNYDVLRSSIGPDIEMLTGDFGTRDRILNVGAGSDGKYTNTIFRLPSRQYAFGY